MAADVPAHVGVGAKPPQGSALLLDGADSAWTFELLRCNAVALLALLLRAGLLTPLLAAYAPDLLPLLAADRLLVAFGVFHAAQFLLAGLAGVLNPRFREANVLFTKYRALPKKTVKAD
jgi:hypothetical protein